jgi:hypothetical protein
MARSNTIWSIQKGDVVIRLFTVKHECASWLDSFYKNILGGGHTGDCFSFDDIKVFKYIDNQQDLDWTSRLDVTNNFIEDE